MTALLDVLGLAGAGVLAGLLGTAGGITSAVSYPALLISGLPARGANIANNLSLVSYLPGSAAASGPELAGRSRWLVRHVPVVVAGSAAGAGLLLATPSATFARVVPFFIGGASLALLLEHRLRAWYRRRSRPGPSPALPATLFVLAVYNGYFGGGAGVMILTLLLVLVDGHLPRANALKNVLIGASQLACVAVFVGTVAVPWRHVLPLAVGILVGGNLGPRASRRLPGRILRPAIAVLGFAVAVWLFLDPGA